MEAKFLLVGLASDGPTNAISLYRGDAKLDRLYGANYTQQFTISPTASSVTLSYEPVYDYNDELNGKRNQLYSPVVTGNILQFGSVGGSGDSRLHINYTPYLGKEDLLFAAAYFYAQRGGTPYIARIGGTKATCTINGWLLESLYEGAKYNSLRLTWTGSSLAVSGMAPRFPDTTYVGEWSQIIGMISKQEMVNAAPFRVAQYGSTTPPATTFVLSGGTDGSFDEASVSSFLESHIFPTDISYVVLLGQISSGMITSIDSYLGTDMQPRMFLAAAPEYTTPTSSYLTNLVTALPTRNPMLALVLGEVTIADTLKDRTRHAVEKAAISFAQNKAFNITNLPLLAKSFYPILSETDLRLCKANGIIPLMRYIKNDVATYEGVNSSTNPSFLYTAKVAEISAIANQICFSYLGFPLSEGRQPSIENKLFRSLVTVSYFMTESITVTVVAESMYVDIIGRLPNEILEISFIVKN